MLFSRNCFAMSLIPGFICTIAKASAFTPYDHIGLVVADETTGQLNLLEANMGGVTAYNLQERLTKSKASHFAVRKLVHAPSSFHHVLSKHATQLVGQPYNPSFVTMTQAYLASVTSHASPISVNYAQLQRTRRELQQTSSTTSPTAVAMTMTSHDGDDWMTALENRTTSLFSPPSPPSPPPQNIPSKGYYCSHLVASVLTSAGEYHTRSYHVIDNMTLISSLPSYHAEYHVIRPSSLHSLYVTSCIILYLPVSLSSLFNPMYINVKTTYCIVHPFSVYPFFIYAPMYVIPFMSVPSMSPFRRYLASCTPQSKLYSSRFLVNCHDQVSPYIHKPNPLVTHGFVL